MSPIKAERDEERLSERVASLEGTVTALSTRLEASLARLFELERMAGAQWLADGKRDDIASDILLDELVVPMTMRLSASQGLHRLEYTEDGRPFRWSGPNAEFGFNGYVGRRRGGWVKLDVLWKGPNTDVSQIRGFADDEEIVLGAEKAGDGWTVSGAIPPRNVLRMSAFRFIAPELFRATPRGDLLGLAILGFSYRARSVESAVSAT